MRLIHLSDLHIGKKVNEFSMLEDQRYILREILKIIDSQQAEGVMICGDIYDKSVPPAEAVTLLDEFLTELARRNLPVFMISGNHDSPQRLDFGARLMAAEAIYISGIFEKIPQPVVQTDAYGEIHFYLLPFIKPASVRHVLGQETEDEEEEEQIRTYQDALARVMEQIPVNPSVRNVLLAHQFVTGAVCSESEELYAGGQENVDASLFDAFDYVALGHIHRPQKICRETVRYCGTPLKYSFSEASQIKSVTIVDLKQKGETAVRQIPLTPLRDLREIRGTYEELTARSTYEGTAAEDYLHVTLTDENDIMDAMNRLRTIYPNIMKLDYDNRRTRENREIRDLTESERKSPMELLEDFYEQQNNQPMQEAQRKYLTARIEEIWDNRERTEHR
jgi:exonuclease SbcD